MVNTNRAALYAAMYDAEPAAKRPHDDDAALPGLGQPRKSRRIVMGAVGFDAPTVEYVESLHKKIDQQDRVIEEQSRHMKRLDVMLMMLRNTLRRHLGAVADLSRDVENKLDRRELS